MPHEVPEALVRLGMRVGARAHHGLLRSQMLFDSVVRLNLPDAILFVTQQEEIRMGKIERIEAEVRTLSAEELAAFREWFREFDERVWDEKIEADVRGGKLDAVAEQALGAHHAGNKPVADPKILPTSKRLAELSDVLGSLPRLPGTEAEEFAQDVASARSELAAVKVRDSWAS